MSVPARLCIVRHGETDWNAAGILQGSIDTHLNATGLRQAYEIAREAAPIGFSRIYSSPLLRARVTARMVADVLGLPAPRLHPGIRERYFGAIQGVPKAELAELNPLLCQQILRRNPLADFPEGEPLDEFVARILAALVEIGGENPGARVLVITHGWVMDVVTRHVRHLPPSAILNMKRKNGESLWLESDGQRIALLSDHAFELAHPDYLPASATTVSARSDAMSTPPLQRYAWLSIATSILTLGLKFGAFGLSNSVSLLSDAIESLVNLTAGVIALWALWLAGLPADRNHAFGHHKAEYFSSAAEGALILLAAASIVWAALERFAHPGELAQLGWGLIVSFLASACNFVTARILLKAGRQHDSITLEADAHHLMTDVWTSVGIGAGLLVVLWAPELAWLDPLLAVAVAANILLTAFRLLRRSAHGLMDAALPAAELAAIEAAVEATLAGRGHLRQLRTRKSGAQRFVEATLILPDTVTVRDSHAICDAVECAIQRGFVRPPQVVLHVEPEAATPARRSAD